MKVISLSVCSTRLENLTKDKHSSLLLKFFNHEKKVL
jgi:hypothetical protein